MVEFASKDVVEGANRTERDGAFLERGLAQNLPTAWDASPDAVARAGRLLHMLDTVAKRRSIVADAMPFLRHPHPCVRSKAAILIGRRLKSVGWANKYLNDSDPRVRANIIEALWGIDLPGVRELFAQAITDSARRVVGNAIYGLYLLGDPQAEEMIRRMAAQPEAADRRTAIWIMRKSADGRFRDDLRRMMKDTDTHVKKAALNALLTIQPSKEAG